MKSIWTSLTLLSSFISIEAKAPGLQEARNVFSEHITMSGYSSGGNFAQMLQISYSSMFDGIGVFSHTFYRCGLPNGNVTAWDRLCTTLDNLDPSELYQTSNVFKDIDNYYSQGLIENPQNLKNTRLYVYGGLSNELFSPAQQFDIIKIYGKYITDPYQIRSRAQDSHLLMPTNNYGLPCTQNARSHYSIGNCGFSGAYEAIKFLYHHKFHILDPSLAPSPINVRPLKEFDQTKFYEDMESPLPFMDSVGYYYVPQGCLQRNMRRCLLHLFFHGCETGRQFNGPNFILHSGYLEMAEVNNIVMIFPQAVSTADGTDGNGCWDTFGAGGEHYATQNGSQVTVVKRMIDYVLGA